MALCLFIRSPLKSEPTEESFILCSRWGIFMIALWFNSLITFCAQYWTGIGLSFLSSLLWHGIPFLSLAYIFVLFLTVIVNVHTVKIHSFWCFDKCKESGHQYHSTKNLPRAAPLRLSTPLPLISGNHWSIPIFLPYPECHIHGILQPAAFWFWLLSFHKLHWRFVQVVASISTAFFRMDKPQLV